MRRTVGTRSSLPWLVLAGLLCLAPDSLARDPYIQFPPCEGGEVGYWQVEPITTRTARLVLTSQDINDPAYVVCYVASAGQVMALPTSQKKDL